jgi:class 3 adenylate cyclase
MEAIRASEEMPAFSPRVAGLALNELGEIRLRMGSLDAAEEAFTEARELGCDAEPGSSLLRLRQGDPAAALAGLEEALDGTPDKFSRSRLLLPIAEVALAAGDVQRAGEAAAELESVAGEYGGTLFEACALQARGMVQTAQGDAATAARSLRRAVRLWQQVDAPYETAQARVYLGRAYQATGDTRTAAAELRAAQSTFERLGAARDAQLAADEAAGMGRAEKSTPGPQERRAFLFTDIVSSTSLLEAIGDDAWRNLVLWHDRTLQGIFRAHGGEEVEHRGDGYFAAFGDAESALTCAVAIQRTLAEHRQSHGFSPRVRIGVHLADAARTGSTYQGRGVHEAARIAALAGGDEILACAEMLEAAGPRFQASEPRSVELKGMARPVEVRAVEWR